MFMKRVTPALENCMYVSLQHSACISDALSPEVIASRKTVFQVRYFRRQVLMGSHGGLLRAARTSSRHQVGNNYHSRNAFGVLEAFDPNGGGGGPGSRPKRNSCHVTLKGIHQQSH